jgi:hypothetical protein
MARPKKTTLLMINSVGEHVAGTQVKLDPDEADRFILMGYAEGELSREFSDEERNAFRSDHQEVSI